MRLEKETFGRSSGQPANARASPSNNWPRETKLSVELWEALEDNNLARWPKRVFARSYVRDYADARRARRRRSGQRVLPAVP